MQKRKVHREKIGVQNRRNLYLMYAMALLQGMVFYAPAAMLYRQAAGLNVVQTAVTESVCLALSVCLEVPWGVAADNLGYCRTLQICGAWAFCQKLCSGRQKDSRDFWRSGFFLVW